MRILLPTFLPVSVYLEDRKESGNMTRSAKPLVFVGIAVLMLVIAACWSSYRYQSFTKNQTQQLLLLSHLQAGSELLVAESVKLLGSENQLSAVQKQHDLNIVHFQTIAHGNLKETIAPLPSITSVDLNELKENFEPFSTTAATIIQDRANVSKLAENRESMILAARNLADKAESLALGLQQINANSNQIADGYQLAMALNRHYVSVQDAFKSERPYQALDIDSARQTLEALSTGKTAPGSAIIKRSAAHLLTEVESFESLSKTLSTHRELKQTLSERIDNLKALQQKLSQTLQNASDQLESEGSSLLLLSAVFWFASLTLSCVLTIYTVFFRTMAAPVDQAAPQQQPKPASEQTSSHYLNQLKTDKNKLMNDIRPLGEGVLYIRADEHLESTGDLARCLNQSREALILKIESLRKTVDQLQSELSATQQAVSSPSQLNIDTTPIENLTYKTQAELEGLNRKIRAQKWEDSETAKGLLIHCMRADRLLDEIRVRVKKGLHEMVNESADQQAQLNQPKDNLAIQRLIEQMVNGLDEFQTQAPKSRRRQAG